MHGLGRCLLLVLLPNQIICSTLDFILNNFDFSALRNFDIGSLVPILNPPSFVQLAAQNGFPAETHEVTTEDGYILTLFRIRGNRSAPPILLFHGLLDSADTWIVRGESSIAVTLANSNYDVWLGNARGNRYSRRHTVFNPDVDRDYWNFSFDEHGLFDLPATIDFILNNTGAPKLNMFGHSQGTVMTWILLSTRTEYNNKINVATALAPIAYLRYVQPPINMLGRIIPVAYPILRALGVTNLFGDSSPETTAIRIIAQVPVLGYLILVYGLLFPLCGFDSPELGPEFVRTLALHFPTSASLKNFEHYAQVFTSNVFARFDYGAAGNLAAYNSSTPPMYRFGRVSARVAILAAFNDKLAPIPDVENLRRQLPNVVRYVINPRLQMNHIDYVWGRTAPVYLYRYIFQILDNYN